MITVEKHIPSVGDLPRPDRYYLHCLGDERAFVEASAGKWIACWINHSDVTSSGPIDFGCPSVRPVDFDDAIEIAKAYIKLKYVDQLVESIGYTLEDNDGDACVFDADGKCLGSGSYEDLFDRCVEIIAEARARGVDLVR